MRTQLLQGIYAGDVVTVARWLASVGMTKLEGSARLEIMSYHSFLGANEAMRLNYVPIVTPLLNFARDRSDRLPPDHAFPGVLQ